MVTLIVITHDSSSDLPACFGGIRQQTRPPERILFVDNGSKDSTRDLIRSAGFELKELNENMGFGPAINAVFPEITTSWMLVINPDVRMSPGFLEHLLNALHKHDDLNLGSVTGKLLRAEGSDLTPSDRIDSAGIYFSADIRHRDRGSGEKDTGQYDRMELVFGATGAAVLYRVDAFRQAGGFDDDFFMYREDADLAWRMQLTGYRCLYVPDAVAFHRRTVLPENRGSLPPTINMHGLKNRYLLRINNQTLLHFIVTLPTSLPRETGIFLYCLIKERSSLAAYRYIFQEWSRLWIKRRRIMNLKTRSTWTLIPWFFGRRCESLS